MDPALNVDVRSWNVRSGTSGVTSAAPAVPGGAVRGVLECEGDEAGGRGGEADGDAGGAVPDGN